MPDLLHHSKAGVRNSAGRSRAHAILTLTATHRMAEMKHEMLNAVTLNDMNFMYGRDYLPARILLSDGSWFCHKMR